ncbi:hypothetical protein EDC04DRAFT_1507626 [Pisolithus marmoratus]|nr:hypothetical protein EDC04DRAFT_1507626 [Pisolithus marmoratus]
MTCSLMLLVSWSLREKCIAGLGFGVTGGALATLHQSPLPDSPRVRHFLAQVRHVSRRHTWTSKSLRKFGVSEEHHAPAFCTGILEVVWKHGNSGPQQDLIV